MVITTTAIGFIVLTIGLSICGAWFTKAFRKSGGLKTDNKIGFLLSLLFIGGAIQNGFMGFGLLFFAKNSEALFAILSIDHVFLALLGMLSFYTAYYIFLPHLSSVVPVIGVGLLGITTVVLDIMTHPQPFITVKNGIDLNSNFQLALLTFYLLLIHLAPMFYIFVRLFQNAKTKELKNLSLALSILTGVSIINVFVRLVLLHNADESSRTHLFDTGLVVIGTIFITTLAIAPMIRKATGARE